MYFFKRSFNELKKKINKLKQKYEYVFHTLTANYEITRRLLSLPGCQTTSYLVRTYIKKSTCRFLSSFLKISAAVNVLNK